MFLFRQFDVGIMSDIGFDTLLKQRFDQSIKVVQIGMSRSALRIEIQSF